VCASFLALACDYPPKRLNIVLVVVDTLRADHLEVYGYERPTAPNLVTFAQQSVIFDRAYSHAPWTKPSLATLLTSLPPKDHGVAQWEDRLPKDIPTLAEFLSRQGYRTEAYVSHHALLPRFSQLDRGFDVYDTSSVENGESAHNIISAEKVSDSAIEALQRLESPFFLWLHYFDPHEKYLPHPEHDFGSRDIDLYDAEIAHTDKQLQRVLKVLSQSSRYDDTVVVITADHGEEFFDHGSQFHGRTLFDEVLRVPLIVRAPGLEPGRVDRTLGLIDVAPTLLEMVGLPVPDTFAGQPIPRERNQFRLQEDRTVFAETHHHSDQLAVVKGPWKLIHDRQRKRLMLFDLNRDPTEQFDKFGKQYPISKDLQAVLREYEARPGRLPDPAPVSDEFREVLKALGYVE
jgi:arylsulfatase A-like enzyme